MQKLGLVPGLGSQNLHFGKNFRNRQCVELRRTGLEYCIRAEELDHIPHDAPVLPLVMLEHHEAILDYDFAYSPCGGGHN